MADINNSGVINNTTDLTQPLSINNLGTINVTSAAAATPATFELTNTLTGSAGKINISQSGTLQVDVAASGNTITFGDATGGLTIGQLSSFASTMIIDGLQAGDTIFIPGLPDGFKESYSSITGILTLKDAAGTTTLGSLVFGGTVPSAAVVQNAVVNSLPCFVSGTLIATPDGARPVESLRPGDRVHIQNGGIGQIEWVGRCRVDCLRHPSPATVRPFRIAAHAFRHGAPGRDLLLSPDHAVFVDGMLIPVKHLNNDDTVSQVEVREVIYHHFELREHAIVQAEGLTVETLLPESNKSAFASNGNVTALYPDFSVQNWESKGYAPLIVTGPELDAIRRRLDRRAAVAHLWRRRLAS
jgi:hypothetical protein